MPLTRERRMVQARLTRRYFIRNHMTLILLGVFLSAFGASALLRSIGVDGLALRYAFAVTLSYLTFFMLVRIWLWYVAEEYRPSADDVAEQAIEGDEVRADGRGGGGGGGGGDLGVFGLDEGALILVLLVALLVVVFGSAVYLVYQAPMILSEAAFQVVLTGLLVRPSKKMDEPGWIGSVFRATWVPFALTLVIAGALGYAVQVGCPGATKLVDVWHGACESPASPPP